MFVDELEIFAKAGNGGDGVVRWRHEKFRPMAGPAGGNGGNGGNVYLRAVSDVNKLAQYTGHTEFKADNGVDGQSSSKFGKNAEDLYIDVPVGSRVINQSTQESLELLEVGETVLLLRGGRGGLGNETFKSSTNRAPQESTKGKRGERGIFLIEVALIADVGLIGLPSAGKSTLLNLLTNARSKIGAYPFTTLHPHLGKLYEFTIADLPGLIAGASEGRGLGHRFLRHISRTNMLLHVLDLADETPILERYEAVRNELGQYDPNLLKREEWIVLSKKDLVDKDILGKAMADIDNSENRVFVISENDDVTIKKLSDALVAHLRERYHEGNL